MPKQFNGERVVFRTNDTRTTRYLNAKNKRGALSCTVYKVHSKLIAYLNIRSKILNLLEENIGANFQDWIRQHFLNMVPKMQTTKERWLNWLNFTKSKKFVHQSTLSHNYRDKSQKEREYFQTIYLIMVYYPE